MATSQDAIRSLSREKGSATMHSMRSRTDSERLPSKNSTADENRSPPAIPRAFESMLKTTTETGDIGVFSIKPSRLPQPLNALRRTGGSYKDSELQKPLQSPPRGVSMRDDRKRLPSYSRDASSEVISMYETASQKSASRVFDDPDYRSCSMTQTYSSYSLSNHRSYASLRSQPDGGALLQRPRSPFAYPTRLKRPGFRPSSPALTDGGGIDYSRRAEIERPPYGSGHSTSSPSSLYAQRRKPTALSLRPDANRSTPSLLSQPSPPRQSPSPRVSQRSGAIHNDWQRKNGPSSVNTSPARSTLSLASSVNLYQAVQVSSTTTTPGRIHPPSPLYYDYTEEFDVDDYNQPETLEPPPQFQVEKTIPEDRPLSADLQPCETLDGQGTKISPSSTFSTPSCSTSILQGSPKISQKPNKAQNNTNIFETEQETQKNAPAALQDSARDNTCDVAIHKDVIRMSRLGHGARELSTHVEEAFGLLSPPFFEILSPNNSIGQETVKSGIVSKCSGSASVRDNGDIETQSFSASSYSLNSHPRQVLPPPQVLNSAFAHSHNDTESEQILVGSRLENIVGNLSLESPESLHEQPSTLKGFIEVYRSGQDISCAARSEYLNLSFAKNDRMSQRRSYSVGTGRKEPAELMSTIEESAKSRTIDDKSLACGVLRHGLPATPPSCADRSLVWSESLENSIINQSHLAFHLEGKNGQKPVLDQGLRRNYVRSRGRKAGVPDLSAEDVPNSSCQIPQNLISRSDSPMLAPKPISPARQLRLKNSVPQLMKALPPLPPDQSMRAVSPPIHLAGSDVELPCRFSPLISEPRSTPIPDLQRAEELHQSPETIGVEPSSTAPAPIELGSTPIQLIVAKEKEMNVSETALPPKMKLKLRNSTSLRPISPDDSRPWNLEESYPWSEQNVNIGLPKNSQHEIYSNPKPPKFKLKIIRASNSTLGTVRVNRESADSKPFVAMQARSPKDLLTPSGGIDNIFRQVGRHLHSHRASLSSNQFPNERKSSPGLSPRLDQIPVTRLTGSEASISQPSAASVNLAGPSEVQSFFSDDSSRIPGRHGLRTRLSNLRARMAAPYVSRTASYSHDDINWRDRNGAQAPTPSAARSVDTLHASNSSTEGNRLRRLTGKHHSQKLRDKVTGWLKEAKSAIKARMRSRSVAGECDAGDGPAQLTTK